MKQNKSKASAAGAATKTIGFKLQDQFGTCIADGNMTEGDQFRRNLVIEVDFETMELCSKHAGMNHVCDIAGGDKFTLSVNRMGKTCNQSPAQPDKATARPWNHTKGYYENRFSWQGIKTWNGATIRDANGSTIVTSGGNPNWEANSKLIVAAVNSYNPAEHAALLAVAEAAKLFKAAFDAGQIKFTDDSNGCIADEFVGRLYYGLKGLQ